MSSQVPTHGLSYIVADGVKSFDALKSDSKTPVKQPGNREVLVKLQGASLNYRDLIIPLGKYAFPTRPNVVPGSDGAGTVVAVGENVTRFKNGDKVLTLFNQKHGGGPIDPFTNATGLGGAVDGTFREYGSFDEDGLVLMPTNLNFMEASTLCCSGLTAWNALYGSADHKLKAGDWVLTQGTGAVSLSAIQYAKAAGAKVVATTGSEAKASQLEALGADHIINYKSTPKWGQPARDLTFGKRGFDHIVEVAGPTSMEQSLTAIAMGGVISIIGFVGGQGAEKEPSFLQALLNVCTIRGIIVGSRVQLEELCRAVEANESLRPVIDKQTFTLDQLKEAYQYQWDQKHIGNVCIDIQ